MQKVTSINEMEQYIKANEMILVYFSAKSCGVCRALKPKVYDLLTNFPNIKIIEVETETSVEIPAQYQIFSFPAILFFIEGKEVIREIRYFSIQNLHDKIDRYYRMFYEH
jgi:thiol-disulfide isomerase/thioredoxin